MKTIFVSVLCVLFSGMLLNCNAVSSNTPQNTDQNSQLHREWMLTAFGSYSKSDLIAKDAKINLTEKSENGKIKGTAFMGCNSMFFTSEFKNNGKVKMSEIGSTLKACQDMKLEMDFSKAFRNITTYSVKGHSLTLTDDQGNRMEFIAADWD
ncbi:META domain-containing protein [Chryseobacterium hispalense]|uniref:META domain-containing protein n=1 Tax=Chryseobacterium hispalense TaxID=1453492 RepID=UPI00391D59B5